MRVRNADRDEGFLEILQSYLWDRGFVVEIALDLHACAANLWRFALDLFGLDCLVPERDLLWGGAGRFLAQSRENPVLLDTRVIQTANASSRHAATGLAVTEYAEQLSHLAVGAA